MAYNNYFPMNYRYYDPYQQAQQAQQMQQAQTQQTPQIQQSGFILVPSEQEARNHPVAPGNSVTFKDQSKPYCYVKTMGFNPFDRPVFERYRLVKEDEPEIGENTPTTSEKSEPNTNTNYATKNDIDGLWGAIEDIKTKIKGAVEKKQTKTKRIVEIGDDEDDE